MELGLTASLRTPGYHIDIMRAQVLLKGLEAKDLTLAQARRIGEEVYPILEELKSELLAINPFTELETGRAEQSEE
jgi:hypothetical protein